MRLATSSKTGAEVAVQLYVSKLLNQYESGSITRRQLIGALTMLMATSGDASAAEFQTRSLDHVSVVAKDPQHSAEFYKDVFGLQVVQPSAAAIAAGALNDGSVRLGRERARVVIRPGTTPGVIDHFAFGVEPFDQDSLARDLNARGIKTFYDDVVGFHVKDPDGVAVQFTMSK
jgi:catechol 2,3-dioxygenase-like lactoylglutathione lyase family enzyme